MGFEWGPFEVVVPFAPRDRRRLTDDQDDALLALFEAEALLVEEVEAEPGRWGRAILTMNGDQIEALHRVLGMIARLQGSFQAAPR